VRPTEMHVAESSVAERDAVRRFACHAGFGLALMTRDDLAEGNLSLPLALSAWLRFTGVEPPGACSGLLGLRRALLETSELDTKSEPTPLLARDPSKALVGLAIYVHGLIARSSSSARDTSVAVVEEALALYDRGAFSSTDGRPYEA